MIFTPMNGRIHPILRIMPFFNSPGNTHNDYTMAVLCLQLPPPADYGAGNPKHNRINK